MRIWQRLVAIVVAFSVPLAVLLYFFYDTAAFRRDFARKEREGNEMLRPLQQALQAATELRTLGARFAADARGADRIVAMRGRIDGLLEQIEALQEKPGLDGPYGDGFDVRSLFEEAETAWRELAGASPPEAAFDDDRHARFVDAIRAALSRVGDKSNLILDPDLDSYYAMDFVLLRAPAFVTGRGDLVRHAETVIRRGAADDRQRAELIAGLGVHRSNVEGARQAFTVAFRENKYYAESTGTMRPALERPLAAFVEAELALVEAIERRVAGAAAPSLPPEELESLREAAVTTFGALYDATSRILDHLLDVRIDDAVGRRDRVLVVVYAIFLATLGLVALIARSITGPLAAGVAAARRISAGDLDVRVEDQLLLLVTLTFFQTFKFGIMQT